jgi:hypothetical protein
MPRKYADNYDYGHAKNRDPYTFKPADDFFKDLDNPGRPTGVEFHEEDQQLPDGSKNPVSKEFGRIFRFNDGKFLLVQFMRPRVWRIRFSHHFEEPCCYSDFNT